MEPSHMAKRARDIYGCDDHPLHYVIESSGTPRMVDKDHVTKPDDFKSILDKYVPAETEEETKNRIAKRARDIYGCDAPGQDGAAGPSGTPGTAKDPTTKPGGPKSALD